MKNEEKLLDNEVIEKFLEMIIEFDRVCRENNIKYFALGGTLLGAVRHKGFIPWDDDVDFGLLRKDYDKLQSVAEKGAFCSPFFFQTPTTDPGYPRCFARLRNSETTAFQIEDYPIKCNKGMFIDIVPLDNIPDNKASFKIQITRLKFLRQLMTSYSRYYSGFGVPDKSILKKVAYFLTILLFKVSHLTGGKIYRRYCKIAAKYEKKECEKVGQIVAFFDNPRTILDKKWITAGTKYGAFENVKIPILIYFDSVLRVGYGDYMIPVRGTSFHTDVLFSATIPYNKYIAENKKNLDLIWNEHR